MLEINSLFGTVYGAISRAYRLYEKRACNFRSDCTFKNSDKCVGGVKWKSHSSPVNATPVLVGVLDISVSSLVMWF